MSESGSAPVGEPRIAILGNKMTWLRTLIIVAYFVGGETISAGAQQTANWSVVVSIPASQSLSCEFISPFEALRADFAAVSRCIEEPPPSNQDSLGSPAAPLPRTKR